LVKKNILCIIIMNTRNKTLLNKDNRQNSKNMNKNIIFREYKKNDDVFIASKDFYTVSTEDNRLCFQQLQSSNCINEVDNQLYEFKGERVYNEISSYIEKKYIHLCVIQDIEFSMEDLHINKQELFKRFIENDIEINQELLEDIYYNQDFSKKINIDLQKVSKQIEDTIEKRYLFRINLKELQCSTCVENLVA
jgi:hypothetical protein